LTNQAGAVVERYTYDPYGKVKVLAANGVTVRTVSAVGNPWTFTGRRLDGETGLMYYRARMYDVGLGRFIKRDPLEYIENRSNIGVYSINTLGVSPPGPYAKRFGNYSTATGTQIRAELPNNSYQYSSNLPTTRLDPQGLSDFDWKPDNPGDQYRWQDSCDSFWSKRTGKYCCVEWTSFWEKLGYSSPTACANALMRQFVNDASLEITAIWTGGEALGGAHRTLVCGRSFRRIVCWRGC